MAIDSVITEQPLPRRHFMKAAGSTALAVCMALPLQRGLHAAGFDITINNAPARVLAAWQLQAGGYQVGVLNLRPESAGFFDIELAVNLPTRPHGLMRLRQDEYLIVARRPGDWMMRLNIRTGKTSRIWQEADRHLNGHSAVYGDLLYTTETDSLNGTGALAVRDQSTFELLNVWPTLGRDPHEMLVLPQGGFGLHEPLLLIANGGIQTHADMGRAQLNLGKMDSSLVALHAHTGKVLNKWVLDDNRLSLRHLAVHASGVVGVAMQAHHETLAQRNEAPVLGLLDQQGLRAAPGSMGVKGYAGDIAATPEGFVLSCPKSDMALRFQLDGQFTDAYAARAACALASQGSQVWLGHKPVGSAQVLEIDNHWLLV